MSYQQTVNEIKAAAETVNPNGRFAHGRHVDLSQEFEGDYPFIYLYPMTISPGVDPNFIDTNTIMLGFWMEDKPESTNTEREAIIAAMDALSTSFIEQLEDSKGVRITSLTKEPQYQMYQGTLSGFAIRFQYQNFTPCPPEGS